MEPLIEEPHGILSQRYSDGAYPELSTISLRKPLAVFEFGVLKRIHLKEIDVLGFKVRYNQLQV